MHMAFALLAVIALVVTGGTWWLMGRVVGGFSLSSALSRAGGGRSVDGSQNILLIGLDTRKDRNGNQLPDDVLAQLHAGDGNEGGYNTNTLILVHIPADRSWVSAVSIPRDDYVPVTGIKDNDHVKIKEAYGLMKNQTEQALSAQGVTDPAQLEEQGREAGRTETIKTVEQFLDVPIDRFAEVSLVGFYDIAKALGGVTVCLNNAVYDSYSGANFRKGVQHLNAAQALAFVRQRHGLANGDLDRTHRQQAFVASVLHALQTNGALSNIGAIENMITATQNDVVISSGWDLPEFAQEMSGLSLSKLRFTTPPIQSYATIDGEDVNEVDTDAVREAVRIAFGYDKPAPPHRSAAPGTSGDASAGDSTSGDNSAGGDGTDAAAATPTPDTGTNVRGGGVPCVD